MMLLFYVGHRVFSRAEQFIVSISFHKLTSRAGRIGDGVFQYAGSCLPEV